MLNLLFILQESERDFNLESFITPIIDVGILLSLVLLMLVLYYKFRIFPIILLVALMSIIIGVSSISLQYNPFTPFFQIFFICFQVVFFLKTATEYHDLKKGND